MVRSVIVFCLGWLAAMQADAQVLNFPDASADDPATLQSALRTLAGELIASFRDPDRGTQLDNLFRFQLVAEKYVDAAASLGELRVLRGSGSSSQYGTTNLQYEIFARAKAREMQGGMSFEDAFQTTFRSVLGGLDDRAAAMLVRMLVSEDMGGLSLIIDQTALRQEIKKELERQKGAHTIALADALRLIRTYQVQTSYRAFLSLTPALVSEDDRRRYDIAQDVAVRTPDGAIVCALIVRQRAAVAARLPTLLQFTIYADPRTSMSEARRSAANGYVGAVGYSRGKACSPGDAVPMEYDGTDAAALIDWISAQPWSDGRVGMFGGSYNGFTQWAAAKHKPKALKALMPSVTLAPGIDVPTEGSIVQSPSYYWPFYVASGPGLNGAAFEDQARWQRMYKEWYASGRAYKDLEKIDGTPNPIWDRWVSHPDYDEYWQNMIPYQKEFASVDLPVLTTTGYYDGGQGGAIYYFQQHHLFRPTAEHYLLIGPYSHITGQRGTIDLLGDEQKSLGGYELDPAAQINIGEIRYQWFDYIFKGAPKPAILGDQVNYEVMGANTWRHAPSLAAMGAQRVRYYLSRTSATAGYELTRRKPNAANSIRQTVDLADRSDVDREFSGSSAAGDLLSRSIDLHNRLKFVTEPFAKSTELSGLFSARLAFTTNKRDFDFSVQLYELMPSGEFMQLSWYLARASYVKDMSHRHLLIPGRPQELAFESARVTSRLIHPGSRLIAVLGIVKQPNHQINYGTGKDVSVETIADAHSPLTVDWGASSYIEVPVRQ